MVVYDILAYRLKKLRKAKSLTQSDVAQIVKVTQHTIYSWETDRQKPSLQKLIKLARFFEVSVWYFYGMDKKTQEALYTSLDEIIYKVKNTPDIIFEDGSTHIHPYRDMFESMERHTAKLIAEYEALPKSTDTETRKKLILELYENADEVKNFLFDCDFERLADIDAEPQSNPLIGSEAYYHFLSPFLPKDLIKPIENK